VLFAPIMGWITHTYGWPYVFYFMGAVGVVGSFLWLKGVLPASLRELTPGPG